MPILRERNTRLLAACEQRAGRVFLPITGTRTSHRDWWRRKLGKVTTVLIETRIEECVRRIHADPVRRKTAAEQFAAVERWFRDAQREGFDLIVNSDDEFVI